MVVKTLRESSKKLIEYPRLTDPFLDFEATREHLGRGSCNYNLSEMILPNGRTLVYFLQMKEGDRFTDTPLGVRRVCEQAVVICGYKEKRRGFLGYLRPAGIRPIPSEEEQDIIEILSRVCPSPVNFWS